MSDYGTMKARIAAELERSDLLAGNFIQNAIQDAIKHREQKRFWFNESRDLTFPTVNGQRIYTATDASWIATVIDIDALFITVGGQNRCLRRRDAADIELHSDNAALVGEPYSWAYWDSTIQLYPIPQQAYTVRAYAQVRLTTLSADADTNAWMTYGERLIRQTAKALICSDVIMDDAAAAKYGGLSEAALATLEEETGRRQATGCVVATQF